MKRLLISLFAFLITCSFFTAQAQTTHSGSVEAQMGFGQAVDVAAGNVFIGEPSNVHQPGLVYIYNRSGMEWSKMTQLEASDGQIGDGFGSAITASESRVLVGAPQQNEGQGASYIFERSSDNSWSQAARIAISDTSAEGFGSSVALHGDHAFIGSPDEQDDAGAVYVFQRDNSGSWMQKTKIANPDTAQGFSFGSALAFDGFRLLVAAPQQKGGAVHVYEADNSGSWTKKATLKSNRVDEDARFGSNVALHNNQVLVSAPRHAAGSGAVFVFKQNADAKKWMSSGRLVAYDSAPRYGFGSSMAFVGSSVWIGAPGAEDGKGAIYEFTRAESGSGWAGVTKMNGPDRKEGDHLLVQWLLVRMSLWPDSPEQITVLVRLPSFRWTVIMALGMSRVLFSAKDQFLSRLPAKKWSVLMERSHISDVTTWICILFSRLTRLGANVVFGSTIFGAGRIPKQVKNMHWWVALTVHRL